MTDDALYRRAAPHEWREASPAQVARWLASYCGGRAAGRLPSLWTAWALVCDRIAERLEHEEHAAEQQRRRDRLRLAELSSAEAHRLNGRDPHGHRRRRTLEVGRWTHERLAGPDDAA